MVLLVGIELDLSRLWIVECRRATVLELRVYPMRRRETWTALDWGMLILDVTVIVVLMSSILAVAVLVILGGKL